MNADVVIIGGGVMGLLSARELAARGATVTLLDRGPLAGEASWAGGGIVSPLYPWRYRPAISALAARSQRAYRELAPQLEAESGIAPELRRKGLLMMAVPDADKALRWAREQNAQLTEIGVAEAAALEPQLAPLDGPRLWMPEVDSIRNPRLGQALVGSLRRQPGVTLLPATEVRLIEHQGGQVTGVRLAHGRLQGDRYLLCGGAWSAGLLQPLGVALPIEPVKGQMMLFDTDGSLLERVVLADGRYLIPRSDGRILVGSTLEQTGFDKRVTAEAHRSLYRSAIALLPALASQPLIAQWAGLRPGSPGGVPFIGAVPGFDNLYLNAGHFRNGLVLAPASCQLIAELIGGQRPSLDPAPYAVDAERDGELL